MFETGVSYRVLVHRAIKQESGDGVEDGFKRLSEIFNLPYLPTELYQRFMANDSTLKQAVLDKAAHAKDVDEQARVAAQFTALFGYVYRFEFMRIRCLKRPTVEHIEQLKSMSKSDIIPDIVGFIMGGHHLTDLQRTAHSQEIPWSLFSWAWLKGTTSSESDETMKKPL